MEKLVIAWFALLCFVGATSLPMADDAMKSETGRMMEEMKAQGDAMKSQGEEMKVPGQGTKEGVGAMGKYPRFDAHDLTGDEARPTANIRSWAVVSSEAVASRQQAGRLVLARPIC